MLSDADFTDESFTQIARLMSGEGKAYEQDSRLIVKFYTGTLLNDTKTKLAGRPIYDDIEKVRILKVGERDYLDKGANPEYIRRFQRQYEAYKKGEEDKHSGTPLSMWPLLKPSQAKELEHFNVHTVEQLAELPDVHVSKFMGGHALKKAAQEYVARAVTQAPLVQVHAQLEERDQKIALMEAQMARMSEIMKGLQAQQGLADSPAAAPVPVVSAPSGAVAYKGPEFPVAADAQLVNFNAKTLDEAQALPAAPKRRGRPPKASQVIIP